MQSIPLPLLYMGHIEEINKTVMFIDYPSMGLSWTSVCLKGNYLGRSKVFIGGIIRCFDVFN